MENDNKPKSVLNNRWLGLSLGLFIPLLTLIFVSAEANRHLSLIQFLRQLHEIGRLSSLFSLSAIPNLGLFFLFIWKKYYYTVQGVMISTVILVVVVFGLKFVF